jgi:hypothetical protein
LSPDKRLSSFDFAAVPRVSKAQVEVDPISRTPDPYGVGADRKLTHL